VGPWTEVGGRIDDVDKLRAKGANGKAGAIKAVQKFL
jgi:hypothetical protein